MKKFLIEIAEPCDKSVISEILAAHGFTGTVNVIAEGAPFRETFKPDRRQDTRRQDDKTKKRLAK